MARLVAERDNAVARIDELERQQRSTAEAREATRAQLIEFERRGDGRPAMREKLEAALEDAERKASERWPERLEGARHAARDAQQELQRHVVAHLHELVKSLESDGEAVAARLTEHASGIMREFHERERIAGQIGQLLMLAGVRPSPGDVSGSHAQTLVNAAAELVAAGGERPPTLRPDVGRPRLGEPVEQVVPA
jgi:chromosome segregation ATPase